MRGGNMSKKLWTKSEIKTVVQLWNTKTTAEIADELKRPHPSIGYIAKKIRDAGYDLPKKQRHGTISLLVKEVLRELQGE